jgi:hypothetical protein
MFMPCYSPITLRRDTPDEIEVPCSRCIGCLKRRQNSWGCRLSHELLFHDAIDCHFITLTYDDKNLVWASDGATLYPRHLELFLKRLRKVHPFRYFACGEYGDKTGRPHYHLLLFGFPLDDFISYDNTYKTSDLIDHVWGHGSHNLIGSISNESIFYCAKYVTKKAVISQVESESRSLFKKNEWKRDAIPFRLPEFARMSRRPGIGSRFYEKFFSDIFPRGYVSLGKKEVKFAIPRYYFEKLRVSDPKMYEILKHEQRTMLEEILLDNPDSQNFQMRLNAETVVLSRISANSSLARTSGPGL